MQTQCSADLFGFELPRLCARGAVRRRQHATSSAGALLPGDGSEVKGGRVRRYAIIFRRSVTASTPRKPPSATRASAHSWRALERLHSDQAPTVKSRGRGL
jgi:hypothetical protein